MDAALCSKWFITGHLVNTWRGSSGTKGAAVLVNDHVHQGPRLVQSWSQSDKCLCPRHGFYAGAIGQQETPKAGGNSLIQEISKGL